MLPTVALADNKDAATTDEYEFDLSTPSSFNADDGKQPFGNSGDIKGNLNPTKEISILESSGNYYSSRVYDFDERRRVQFERPLRRSGQHEVFHRVGDEQYAQ